MASWKGEQGSLGPVPRAPARAAPVRLDLLRESRGHGGVRPEQPRQAEPMKVTGRMVTWSLCSTLSAELGDR